ncbi:hypothetical protein POX_c04713 [Penicillium oxalicum]|nr:hypothetical protein POX_c04713 [Penicillium oxalicum]KAI2791834.1 hypothetical protein POX_c04713 [Penicillium oxalicum]
MKEAGVHIRPGYKTPIQCTAAHCANAVQDKRQASTTGLKLRPG